MFKPLLAKRPTGQVPRARLELPMMFRPPRRDLFRIGPGKILVGVHFHVFVVRIFRGTGLEAGGPFSFQVGTGDVRR